MTNRRLFGTDGMRGTANVEPMTAATALKVAMAAARRFRTDGHHSQVVIGKDTRLSGYLLEPALTAGFIAMGVDVILVGPLPTPAISMLVRSMRADLGVMISASHNPYDDNGIKIFGPDGHKIDDAAEAEIEAAVSRQEIGPLPAGRDLGRAARIEDAQGRYIESVKSSFPRRLTLDGLKLVVDCAHGAAYRVAPQVFAELGAEVVTLGVAPNGLNINGGVGATATVAMRARVVETGADMGIALDGDADRLIVADETGTEIDGDQIMAMIATSWHAEGRLRGGGIAATVMSNLGLERALAATGLTLHRTAVGDRNVVARMREAGLNIGGEQSGHIVLSDFATTGDGILAALQVLASLVDGGGKASRACRQFTPVPQLLRNVRYDPGRGDPTDRPDVQAAVRSAGDTLGPDGRILIRKSGTEPLIRVMAEGDDEILVARTVDRITAALDGAGPAGSHPSRNP